MIKIRKIIREVLKEQVSSHYGFEQEVKESQRRNKLFRFFDHEGVDKKK